MIIDNSLVVSDAQAVTADAVSTSSIDLGAAGIQIADGEPMCFVVTVDVAATQANANETYALELIESASSNLGTATVLSSRTIAYTDLTAGSKWIIPVTGVTKRYIGMNYNVGGTAPAVTVSAALMPQSFADKYKSYPNGYTIS